MPIKTISLVEKAFWDTPKEEIFNIQEKMDKIAESLTQEQLIILNEIFDWVSREKVLDEFYDSHPR